MDHGQKRMAIDTADWIQAWLHAMPFREGVEAGVRLEKSYQDERGQTQVCNVWLTIPEAKMLAEHLKALLANQP
jgi:hypothetical protein